MRKNKLLFGLLSIALFSVTSCTANESSRTISSSVEMSSVEIINSEITQDIYYHVQFLNDDNSLLYEVDVLKGENATYIGETPTKKEDDEFTYEFIGWDKSLEDINDDLTVKALYKSVGKENWSPIVWF